MSRRLNARPQHQQLPQPRGAGLSPAELQQLTAALAGNASATREVLYSEEPRRDQQHQHSQGEGGSSSAAYAAPGGPDASDRVRRLSSFFDAAGGQRY